MALFQPSNITPSSFAGVGGGTIDAYDKFQMSWQLNGNSQLVGYCIDSYIKNADGTYTSVGHFPPTGDLTNDFGIKLKKVDPPVFPTDAKGNPTVFVATDTSGNNNSWASSGMEFQQGKSYALYITQVWQEGTTLKKITQVAPSAIITRETPTLTITRVTNGINENSVKFIGTFSQAENDTISWAQWVLYNADGDIIDDTFPIATMVLEYFYEGLLAGDYRIVCTVESSSGQLVSAEQSFTISQDLPAGTQSPIAYCRSPYSLITWNKDAITTSIPPTVNRETEFTEQSGDYWLGFTKDSSTALPAGIEWSKKYINGLSYDLLGFPGGSYIYLRCKISDGLGFTLYRGNHQERVTLTFSKTNKKITIQSPSISVQPIEISLISEFLTIELNLVDKITIYDNGKVTSTSLTGFYLSSIDSIYISCEDIDALVAGVAVSTVPLTVTDNMFQDGNPSQKKSGILFLTNFANRKYNAGDTDGLKSSKVFYRKEANEKQYLKMGVFDSTITSFKDFGIVPSKKFFYKVYNAYDGSYLTYEDSNEISPYDTAYYLIEGSQTADEPNIFHVLRYWKFGNNISAGSVSNNNTPNWLTNFTGYRLRQASSRRGRSGTLQALLSNVSNVSYADTSDFMDSLYGASLSRNTFFLKDTKGNIYKVAISAPITQTINTKTNVQEVTVSIPWEEIGTMKNVALIQTSEDANWNNSKQN